MKKMINIFKNSKGETTQVYPLNEEIVCFVNVDKQTIKFIKKGSEISEETLELLNELKIALD